MINTDSSPVIEARGLTKVFRIFRRRAGIGGAIVNLFKREYEDVRAVDGVSFAIEPGELLGYIGPNGAGKSTTIKMLCGIIRPTEGTCRVLGRDPHRQRVANARDVGVMFGQRSQLWWDIAVQESFRLLEKIYEVPREEFKKNLAFFTEVLELNDLLRLPVRKLSLGQRVRCELAGTLLHNPRVVYLDEPTIGLDVSMQHTVREFIRSYNTRHESTVLLTSHYMDDVLALCPTGRWRSSSGPSADGGWCTWILKVRRRWMPRSWRPPSPSRARLWRCGWGRRTGCRWGSIRRRRRPKMSSPPASPA
ncbi:MAG: ATP-binding cassette domain-containing protein [bacterium]|nr:ATP-binding cassette domain-containing protein [bacterium]